MVSAGTALIRGFSISTAAEREFVRDGKGGGCCNVVVVKSYLIAMVRIFGRPGFFAGGATFAKGFLC
eukprot:NODE_2822_length_869_cov_348.267813.p4 GENE.NODE_2822_length_869_cov_348.267813~~NODE_2822_length_869_cov_348.267813.p4  ORF type:complete len:67 (-),score=15.11 NODE_2822_length_869_cov_348.267813:201-401(-)